MNSFKPGDKLLCIDATDRKELRVGVTYTMRDVYWFDENIALLEVKGGYRPNRFVLAKDYYIKRFKDEYAKL